MVHSHFLRKVIGLYRAKAMLVIPLGILLYGQPHSIPACRSLRGNTVSIYLCLRLRQRLFIISKKDLVATVVQPFVKLVLRTKVARPSQLKDRTGMIPVFAGHIYFQ